MNWGDIAVLSVDWFDDSMESTSIEQRRSLRNGRICEERFIDAQRSMKRGRGADIGHPLEIPDQTSFPRKVELEGLEVSEAPLLCFNGKQQIVSHCLRFTGERQIWGLYAISNRSTVRYRIR